MVGEGGHAALNVAGVVVGVDRRASADCAEGSRGAGVGRYSTTALSSIISRSYRAAPAQRAAKPGPATNGAPDINRYGDHAQVAFAHEAVSQRSHVVSSTYTSFAAAL